MINEKKTYLFKVDDNFLNGRFLKLSNHIFIRYILEIYENSVLLNSTFKKFVNICYRKFRNRNM